VQDRNCRVCGDPTMLWWVERGPGYLKAGSAQARCEACYLAYCREAYRRRQELAGRQVRTHAQARADVVGRWTQAGDQVERRCLTCGLGFLPLVERQRFCSRLCGSRRVRVPSNRGRGECPWCGLSFVKTTARQVHCSSRCSMASRGLVRLSSPVDPRRWWVQTIPFASCRHCREVFVASRGKVNCPVQMCRLYLLGVHGGTVVRVCKCGASETMDKTSTRAFACAGCRAETRRVQRAASKRRRRARKRGALRAPYKAIVIHERDGWVCQLCRKKVRRRAKVPHPLAPVIDHILPLAQGGDDVPSNVQCAHFLCNSLKGDRTGPTGDQLRLVG